MRASRTATLGTLMDDGPYASLVTVAFDTACRPLLLLSDLADHTRNVQADRRVSLLFEAASGLPNPQSGPRLTVLGQIVPSDAPDHASGHLRRFIARHPAAKLYSDFSDFNFYRVEVERLHFIGGFGAALWLSGDEAAVDDDAAQAMAECETVVVHHMNTDHADAVTLYANKLLGKRGKAWKMIGVDPDGLDLKLKNTFVRLNFDEPVHDAASCRAMLVALAEKARSDN
jgi:putative heme iron utilization protein